MSADQNDDGRTTQDAQEIDLDQLLVANNLRYRIPPALSLFNQRQSVRYDAQNVSYAQNSTMNISLSNSDIFVNGHESYLHFVLTVSGQGTNSNFGLGSACNIIKNVKFIHSSGVELSHAREVNLYNYSTDQLIATSEWDDSYGIIKGYGAKKAQLGAGHPFAIKLSEICPVFNSRKLITPFLLSGARLEITLESNVTAFVDDDGTPVMAVSNPYVLLDSYILSDASFNAIEKLSAAGAVEHSWTDWEHLQSNPTSASVNIELTKSLGRASSAIVVPRTSAGVVSQTAESIAPDVRDPSTTGIQDYFFRLNSLYLPARTASGGNSYVEQYLESTKDIKNTRYKVTDFYDDAAAATAKGQIVRQQLQRNNFLGITSGLPVNASSALRFTATMEASSGMRLDMFVPHMVIVTPFLYDRVSVEV